MTGVTLRTHEVPDFFGATIAHVRATSAAGFRTLVGRFVDFYAASLHNAHWGESVAFGRDDALAINMVSQGLDKESIARVWQPFFDWSASPSDYVLDPALVFAAIPARSWWDAAFWNKAAPTIRYAIRDRMRDPPTRGGRATEIKSVFSRIRRHARSAGGSIASARARRRRPPCDARLTHHRTGQRMSESDYFNADWRHAYWGLNYPRLAAVKRSYDPHGLFFTHNGVGSEEWSADGFTRLAT